MKTFSLVSRTSFWLFIGAMATALTAYAVYSAMRSDYPPAVGFALFVLMLAIFLYPSRIEVDEKEVRLRSGLFISRRIPLDQIVRIREATTTGALSLRKEPGLQIQGSNLTLNAPVQDVPALLQALMDRMPDLHAYGGEYRRSGSALVEC